MSELIDIVINGEMKQAEKRDYSFQELITLAFGNYDDSQKSYTITATRKNDDGGKHKETFSIGDSIKMKEGMRFNVDSTNRS